MKLVLLNSLQFWQIYLKPNCIALTSAELFSVSKEIHKIHNGASFKYLLIADKKLFPNEYVFLHIDACLEQNI